MLKRKSLRLLVAPLLFSGVVHAADVNVKPVAYSPTEANSPLLFGAPPRESAEEATRIYQPFIDYLSKAIGRKIVLKYPRTWGVYRTEMINGRYDIVFDGPHFNSYRAEKLQHKILVRLEDTREFVIVALKDDKIASTADLAGHTLCVQPPPNLATLLALAQFEGAAAQPLLVPTRGWGKVYNGIKTGRCAAGAFPLSNLQTIDKNNLMKVLYKTAPIPEQALSVGPRVSAAEQAKIVAALTAPEALAPSEKVLATAQGGDKFVATNNQEYAGLGSLLKKEWGFYNN